MITEAPPTFRKPTATPAKSTATPVRRPAPAARKRPRRGPHLLLDDGVRTRLIELEPKITQIGSGVTAHVHLSDEQVSPDHAFIVRHGEHARLLDNYSETGTYVNGRRVRTANIRDGDVLEVGRASLQYIEIS